MGNRLSKIYTRTGDDGFPMGQAVRPASPAPRASKNIVFDARQTPAGVCMRASLRASYRRRNATNG